MNCEQNPKGRKAPEPSPNATEVYVTFREVTYSRTPFTMRHPYTEAPPMSPPEIFLSWSKSISHAAAKAFRELLPAVLGDVKPWVSSEDIRKGTGWFGSISDQLARSHSCLLFVTSQNIKSQWLYYEAGAVALARKGERVYPYLIDVSTADIGGTPLGQYQVTRFEKEDTRKLIRDLNDTLDSPLPRQPLDAAFEAFWQKLLRKINKALTAEVAPSPSISTPPAPPSPPPLSAVAADVLIHAAQGKRQTITMNESMHGFSLTAGDQEFARSPLDRREEAGLRAIVEELLGKQFIRDVGSKGEVFELTKAGYDMADDLDKHPPSPPPASEPQFAFTHDDDIVTHLQGWFAKHRRGTRTTAISYAEVDREERLPPGSAARLLKRAAEKANYVVDSEGPSLVTFRHRFVR